jgi:hypothetical protein
VLLDRTEPSEVRKQLDALEVKFRAMPGPLDAPERQALWPALAELNTALGSDDAAVCWLHALWGADTTVLRWAGRWLQAEARLIAQHTQGMARQAVTLVPGLTGQINGPELDRLLQSGDPTTAEARQLVALLLWTVQHKKRAPRMGDSALTERMNAIRQFLEAHDPLLPIRAAWLAWTSLSSLAGGDVLALARARDRLLERLYQQGLRPEQELPTFLRFGGQALGHRFRAIGKWMLEMRELVGKCYERMDRSRLIPVDRGMTPACLDLIFAFGLARLGEISAAAELQDRAAKLLAKGNAFHQFMLRAYTFRIRQVSDGKVSTGTLPDALLAYLKLKDPSQRHSYDRLREISRIVEPHQRIRWDQDYLAGTDALSVELARLPKIIGRSPLAAECRRVLADYAEEPVARARALEAILEQAPRLGEEFAAGAINRAIAAYDALPPSRDDNGLSLRSALLEKSLFVAAHFDRAEVVHAFVARFQQLLRSQRDAEAPQLFTALAGQCLRGLRKLGMRQEIELLLRQLEELVLKGRKLESLRPEDAGKHGETLLALLHLAAGWYDFGKEHDAESVINVARALLLSGPLPTGTIPVERANLACTYAATLGHAPLEFAQKRIVELFQKLESVATSWHTTPGYCALQLKLAEAVVLAIVSDNFTHGAEMRCWLDDEEFQIRKRIHADVRALMAQSG